MLSSIFRISVQLRFQCNYFISQFLTLCETLYNKVVMASLGIETIFLIYNFNFEVNDCHLDVHITNNNSDPRVQIRLMILFG